MCMGVVTAAASCGDGRSGAAPTTTASTRSLEAELSAYCGAVCKRSTACGLEAADAVVRGHPAEVALLSRLKADAPKSEASCRDACRSTPTSELEPATFAKAERCVEQSTCDALEACLTASAP